MQGIRETEGTKESCLRESSTRPSALDDHPPLKRFRFVHVFLVKIHALLFISINC